MKEFLELITEEMQSAFEKAGYDRDLGRVSVSNRPDLCEYQCNGAMAGAKKYGCPPIDIANKVAALLDGSETFESAEAVMPGFLNLKLKNTFVSKYILDMSNSPKFGYEEPAKKSTIIVDYGGPNVAKALHVGHLRSAVIGEAVKRLCAYAGYEAIGDIHMGDWGLQMGLVITELKERHPELPYFDNDHTGEYPTESPVTIADLGVLYPQASEKSKNDPAYKEKAMEATLKLQNGHPGYRALWRHMMNVSVNNMKSIYDSLDVHFELWKGESDVQDVIPEMLGYLKKNDYMHLSEGAWVIDVKEDTDTKEMPPCIVIKSDGASLYNTTDLATIVDRERNYDLKRMIYLTDKRQDLYFEQVFRAARKAKLVKDEVELLHIGFGTVNGKDGHAFKTREGGVMRLEQLVSDINEKTYERITESRQMPEEEAREIAKTVALAAIKYGDLSNQASKDYIFDMDKFTSFEGDTGPYILYTIVRIKSILQRVSQEGTDIDKANITGCFEPTQKALMLQLSGFNAMIKNAYEEVAPNRICAFIYEAANAFNRFYHEVKIATEEDPVKKESYIGLLKLTRDILETCIDILGFSAPEKM
ncbi:MAG: arginine--tRNA ligase [Lachnospiraceae bacterium]|nr:arginine--tRNA ligase [Lachnospiraceae bacterium]